MRILTKAITPLTLGLLRAVTAGLLGYIVWQVAAEDMAKGLGVAAMLLWMGREESK